jgi:hypothetical protein
LVGVQVAERGAGIRQLDEVAWVCPPERWFAPPSDIGQMSIGALPVLVKVTVLVGVVVPT